MSENTFELGGASGTENLREEVQSLRTVVAFSLLLVVIFTGCVNIFLLRQTISLSRQVQQAQVMVSGFENGGGAQVVDAWTKLNDYARTHPDYQPIINKYDPFFKAHINIRKK